MVQVCRRAMEHMSRILHCSAEGGKGEWEAICLDLDIAVQGASFEEVYRSLRTAISLYLETVETLPTSDRADLLDRPAPFSVRWRFLAQAARYALGTGPDGTYRHQFTLPWAA